MGHPEGTLISLASIVLLGLLTGILVAKFSILPMVVTLAMMYIMRGLAKGVSGRGTVTYNLPGLTNFFINPLIGPVPVHFFVLVIAVIVMYILVNRMKFGSYVEFYCNNPLATRICGINTTRIVLLCYIISMVFAWFAGMIDMFMVSSSDPSKIGLDLETDAIAATLIGGTPITGGYPNIIGSVFGAFLLQLITMMCNMHNIPYSYSMMIKAGIIIFELFFHGLRNKSSR
jgi:ribose/xylose/arabinose/galactoside ABC-type transport system permease subunit